MTKFSNKRRPTSATPLSARDLSRATGGRNLDPDMVSRSSGAGFVSTDEPDWRWKILQEVQT